MIEKSELSVWLLLLDFYILVGVESFIFSSSWEEVLHVGKWPVVCLTREDRLLDFFFINPMWKKKICIFGNYRKALLKVASKYRDLEWFKSLFGCFYWSHPYSVNMYVLLCVLWSCYSNLSCFWFFPLNNGMQLIWSWVCKISCIKIIRS